MTVHVSNECLFISFQVILLNWHQKSKTNSFFLLITIPALSSDGLSVQIPRCCVTMNLRKDTEMSQNSELKPQFYQ